jgi:hypothetical protein
MGESGMWEYVLMRRAGLETSYPLCFVRTRKYNRDVESSKRRIPTFLERHAICNHKAKHSKQTYTLSKCDLLQGKTLDDPFMGYLKFYLNSEGYMLQICSWFMSLATCILILSCPIPSSYRQCKAPYRIFISIKYLYLNTLRIIQQAVTSLKHPLQAPWHPPHSLHWWAG